MKILHICPLPLFSGLEQYALLIANQQALLGHAVAMIVQSGSQLEVEAKNAGLEVISVKASSKLGSLPGALQYRRILDSHPNLDVIHLHSSQDIAKIGLAILFMKTQKNWVRPKIIQQNHIWMSHSKKTPLHWLKYAVLDEVWCSSEPARRDLERFLPVPTKKIKVIRYGRDLSSVQNSFLTRAEARQKLEISPDATVIGAIARIDRPKGIWELLNGAVACMKEGLDFELVIIGGPTMSDPRSIEFGKDIEAFVDSLPFEIKQRIKMPGSIANAGRLLKAFDVYAQASYKETFSLALLDAQLAELPVIGTSSGGTPEVVIEGATGWLGAPESIDEMTNTIRRALSEREKWLSYGLNAGERVKMDFDLLKVMDTIIKRYQNHSYDQN
jgi:D-inositol-3-phosphate glycosyltransferase